MKRPPTLIEPANPIDEEFFDFNLFKDQRFLTFSIEFFYTIVMLLSNPFFSISGPRFFVIKKLNSYKKFISCRFNSLRIEPS